MMGECKVFQALDDLERFKIKSNCYVSSDSLCKISESSITAIEAKHTANILQDVEDINVNEEFLDVENDSASWSCNHNALESMELSTEFFVDATDVICTLKSQLRILPMSMISTKTFARPKKNRPSLSSVVQPPSQPQASDANSSSAVSKLRRRLTTTIDPSPHIIQHLHASAIEANRPVSANIEDQRWEDGAADVQAENMFTPRSTRPTVSASLLQRLQEIKKGNLAPPSRREEEPLVPNFKTNSPLRPPQTSANPMSVSQLLREIPDPDSVDLESYLSITESLDTTDPNRRRAFGESLDITDTNRRLTFGGHLLPSTHGRTHGNNASIVQTANLCDLTFTAEEQFGLEDMQKDDDQGCVTNNIFVANQANDENRNHDVQKVVDKLLGYSSNVFDSSFSSKRERNRTFCQANEILNTINKSQFTEEKIEDNKQVEAKIEALTNNGTITVNQKTETNKINYSSATYTRVSKLATFRDGIPRSPFFKSQENLIGRTSRTSSRDNLERSPARSEDGKRSNLQRAEVSRETLILSPAPSDGAIDRHHGTYTRNSPVERYVSEDEQMSTTSDHSTRSHESIDEIPNQNTHRSYRGKFHGSTPILTEPSRQSPDWEMSPISRAKTSVSPMRANGHGVPARKLVGTPMGAAPLKQPLIQPTNNFSRRAIIKKSAPSATIRNPIKSEPMTPRNFTTPQATTTARASSGGSSLPKLSKLPAPRLPVRTSSIPQPNSRARPSLNK